MLPSLRIIAPIAIIAWLIYRIQKSDPESLATLTSQRKNWFLLTAAFFSISGAVFTSFFRWRWLVLGLGIPFSIRDAFRLGLLGYLFNFISPGVVGGDLFKAVFIAREKTEKRPEAVASVLIDRIVGLFGLLCVASIALCVIQLPDKQELQLLRNGTFLFTAMGAVGVTLLMIPSLTRSKLAERVCSVPKVGAIIRRVINGIELYQQQKRTLFAAVAISVVGHSLIAVGIHCAANGVFEQSPTLHEHLVISPLAGVAGSVPLLPGGVGQYELAIENLYATMPKEPVAAGQGLVVAFCYRIITVLIATIGGIFYLFHRREVKAIVREAESMAEDKPQAAKTVREVAK